MFCLMRNIEIPLDLAVCRMHQGQKCIFTILSLLHECKLNVIFLTHCSAKGSTCQFNAAYQLPWFMICSNKDIKSREKNPWYSC